MVKWSRIKTLLIALLMLGNTTSNASNLYRLIDGEILDALNIMSVENCNERTFSVNVKKKRPLLLQLLDVGSIIF